MPINYVLNEIITNFLYELQNKIYFSWEIYFKDPFYQFNIMSINYTCIYKIIYKYTNTDRILLHRVRFLYITSYFKEFYSIKNTF